MTHGHNSGHKKAVVTAGVNRGGFRAALPLHAVREE
jgi:hypothetical protein